MRNLLPGCMLALFSFTACQMRDNDPAIKLVINTIEQSNEVILDENKSICIGLEEKTKDPQTSIKALIWEPKAHKIRELTAAIIQHINNLRNKLKINDNAATESRLQKVEMQQLYLELVNYSNHIVAIFDTVDLGGNVVLQQQVSKDVQKIRKEGVIWLGISTDNDDSRDKSSVWAKRYTNISNPLLSLAMLSRLKNDLLVTENSLLAYCNNHTTIKLDEYIAFQPLVIMDRSYVRPGERIEVSAGVTTFYFSTKAITIDGKKMPLGNGRMASYRFTATGKPGKYTVPLTIEYTLPDGSQAIVNKLFTYTIAP